MGVFLDWSQIVRGDLKTELERMYVKEGMSLDEMEDKLKVSRKPLSKKMKELGIPMRTPGRFNFLKTLQYYPGFLTKPRKQIARELGCSPNTVGVARWRYKRALENKEG